MTLKLADPLHKGGKRSNMIRAPCMEHFVVPAAVDQQRLRLHDVPGLAQRIRKIVTEVGQTALDTENYM